ncbi:transcriptional regulator, TetR family [Streptomyces sp. 2131.1]|uniref:TetR/AcrR family transcriptional regulator n=1 Tax=Streptomyces sp. 2131.1 TaxID=1855346 RepID=UPI0008981E34|nr:TetR/AcrR family transcriptional regulator [Streptomyces sp. 2131.1]SEE77256.1 transcriptional regulator, TetR family [Streptomyces sp. 2131.1]
MAETQQGPRARYREQTRAEIKEVALRQLAEGGVGALALTRIAKALGLSGPALYRYFANRDDLLSALIRDAYDDAATAIGEAAATARDRSPRERLRVLAGAYRAWAVSAPHRYLLIQGSPVPGYVAPDDTLERARAVLGPLLPVFAGGSPGADVASMVDRMAAWLETDAGVGSWVAEYVPDAAGDVRASAVALAGAVLAWAQLHGAVGLEVAGQFAGMGHDGETLLAAQNGMLADAFGLE